MTMDSGRYHFDLCTPFCIPHTLAGVDLDCGGGLLEAGAVSKRVRLQLRPPLQR
jgi:hypothetical protein